jgi:Reverse transcriptase (RNA-dependent DNA polymerase)
MLTSTDEALSATAEGSPEPILDSGDDPSWGEALASPDREFWIAGARDEIKSLETLKVFILVPQTEVPAGQRPLKGKLVCKRKCDDAGNITGYKVHYVAKGYAQRYGIDYDKTAAPTARLESFRTLLHIAAMLHWDIQHIDVKTAFLHGVLPGDETMFMEQPQGVEAKGKENWVMKLSKSIYGMKQVSRVWNQTFDKTVKQMGFEWMTCEWCVYRCQSETDTIIFAVHVDDIISIASTALENERFKEELRTQWEISNLGPIKFALGIAVSRDLESGTILISQTALIQQVIE